MSRKSESKTEIAAVPGQVQRLALFGPPLLLEGEDASAYDQLLARICAAVKPAEYARNERDVVEINKMLACIHMDMGYIKRGARADKAEELVRAYRRREPDAVTLVHELLTDAGVSMDSFMTIVLGDRIEEIERIDRLTAIAETRRNAALREIDRRRAVLGETLRRSVQEIEDDDFADGELVLELPPAEGKNAA